MAKMKVVALLPASMRHRPAALDQCADLADMFFTHDPKQALQELKDAEVLLLWDFSSPIIRDNPLPPRLAWIHTASLGLDAVLSDAVVSSDIMVTNTRGVFERPIAEYVLGLLLMVAKDFRRTLELQRAHEWKWRPTRGLRGQTAVLIGPGAIGREIFSLLHAVGVNVIPVGRRKVQDDPVFGVIHPMDELASLLPKADAVVLSLPLTLETRSIMNKARFNEMKDGTTFINIGRGGLVDEDALLHALEEGRIATAALDVFAVEPLPKGHPFWRMDQVLVSPHMSADIDGSRQLIAAQFLANLQRWVGAKALENVVEKLKMRAASPGVHPWPLK